MIYSDSLQPATSIIWIITGGVKISSSNNTVSVYWNGPGIGKIISEVVNTVTGCKKSSSITITINASPIQSVITRNLGILSTALQTNATYQWYFNGTILRGATNATYNASINNGNYTVSVKIGNCQKTSAGYSYNSTGVNSFTNPLLDFSINPSPNDGNFEIKFHLSHSSGIAIVVHDVTGRELVKDFTGIYSGIFIKNFNIKDFEKRVYYVGIFCNESSFFKKIVYQ